jgi:hypothetical protein
MKYIKIGFRRWRGDRLDDRIRIEARQKEIDARKEAKEAAARRAVRVKQYILHGLLRANG